MVTVVLSSQYFPCYYHQNKLRFSSSILTSLNSSELISLFEKNFFTQET